MSGNVSNAFFIKTYLSLLSRLRESGSVFAKQNPEIAAYLDMSHRQSADPEIERLIESFAFMTAQIEFKSLLSQNEYLLQFIENILPEIIQPVPGLAIVKAEVDARLFIESNDSSVINPDTVLSVKNPDGQTFYFSAASDYRVSPVKIQSVSYITSSSSKENLYNHKNGILFKLKSLLKINNEKKEKTKFRFYINSDLNNVLNLIDSLYIGLKSVIFVDNNGKYFALSKQSVKIPFEFDNYTKQNNNSNCLYPLFDFCKFFYKHFYLEFTIPEFISIDGDFNILLGLNDNGKNNFEIKENIFLDNCFPVFNYFLKNIKPIRTKTNLYEYKIHDDFMKTFEHEIIAIDDVSTIHPFSNDVQNLVHYHKRELANVSDRKIYQNCYWVSRRSFSSETEANGELLLRLILLDETVFLPEYLKIKAFCTNGKSVSKILPDSNLFVEKGDSHLNFKTLNWIQPQENITDIVEKVDIISYLFVINQKILSNNFDNVEDILKAFEILSSTKNPIYLIFQRTLNSVKSIQKISQNDMKIINGAAYHIPGYNFEFRFLSSSSIPLGFFFIFDFLNAYFSYIRGLNFFIRFSYKVEDLGGF